MSPSEVAARLLFAGRHHRWRRRVSWHAPRARVRRVDDWHLSVRPDEVQDDVALLLEEAGRLSNGAFSLLNCSFNQTEIDWHFDPQLGVRAPVIFSPDIDYRDITVAGNVKNIWELNRHQHLTVLANAYSITKDARYADVITSQIDSWLRANPTLHGVNWHSPLELGIRLISWLWIERLLRGSPAHEHLFGDEGVVWPSVYWHQWLMRTCMSRGSSSNNHLIGELAGLFVASTAWPYFDESQTWQRIARRGLEREVLRQTFPSGLNREQAFSYHLFVLELLIVAALEGERAGAPFSAAFKSAVRRMIEAVPLLMDVGGHLPRYGDADDGRAFGLGPGSLRESTSSIGSRGVGLLPWCLPRQKVPVSWQRICSGRDLRGHIRGGTTAGEPGLQGRWTLCTHVEQRHCTRGVLRRRCRAARLSVPSCAWALGCAVVYAQHRRVSIHC